MKRRAYVLLTMHKTVREQFKKQLQDIISPEKLSLEQQGEMALFLGFTVLKSIETATSNKQDFTELSSQFLDFLLENEDGYGIEDSLKDYVLKGISESRFGEYENNSLEAIPKYFVEKMGLQEKGLKDKDIIENVELNFLLVFKEGKKIVN